MFRSVRTRIRYLVFLLLSCGLAMAISFGLVLGMARRHGHEAKQDATTIEEADALRALSNELVLLLDEYLERVAPESSDPSSAFKTWVSESFRPRLNDFRQRITDSKVSSRILESLAKAGNAVSAMAQRPEQDALRRAAIKDVLDARDAVEGHVADLRAGSRLTRQLVAPRFLNR